MAALVKPSARQRTLGVYDPQLRHGCHLPAGFQFVPRNALARFRVVAHDDLVPHQAAIVERIREQPGTMLAIAENCAGAPDLRVARAHGRGSGRRRSRKTLDDSRLGSDDRSLAALAQDWRIAISEAASG